MAIKKQNKAHNEAAARKEIASVLNHTSPCLFRSPALVAAIPLVGWQWNRWRSLWTRSTMWTYLFVWQLLSYWWALIVRWLTMHGQCLRCHFISIISFSRQTSASFDHEVSSMHKAKSFFLLPTIEFWCSFTSREQVTKFREKKLLNNFELSVVVMREHTAAAAAAAVVAMWLKTTIKWIFGKQ